MDNIDMGPEWLWKLGCLFAGLGAVTFILAMLYAAYWAFTHLKIETY